MKKNLPLIILLILLPLRMLQAEDVQSVKDSLLRAQIELNAVGLFNTDWFIGETGYNKRDSTIIDTIFILHRKKQIRVQADRMLSYAPMRFPLVDSLERGMMSGCGPEWKKYNLAIISDKRNIREYVPNYFRQEKEVDRSRLRSIPRKAPAPLVRSMDRSYLRQSVLYNTHIALWHSHGWYFEPELQRWEWQRARIFQTVEDLYPMTYTLQFLIPMLENAGAGVLLPRERDWQLNEVVVDNDGSQGKSLYVSGLANGSDSAGRGFGQGNPPYREENPFLLGSYESMAAEKTASASMKWIPDIPESGSYAVYVSYGRAKKNIDDARYRVYHAGGMSEFLVNQRMGAGTWIYLGKFSFDGGLNPDWGRVELSNESGNRKSVVTGDAVRFGGGTGNIERQGMTSLRPRYQEAARYYLQYAGFPDTLVWKLNDPVHDYKDDYMSRGEWVNYLMGAPSGPGNDPEAEGLGIPVDMAFAFHTDAGITHNDTVVGTLGIYNTSQKKGAFPSGLSRMASRDLTDLVQTQIVEDLRGLYDPAWTRRAMWNKAYSEAFRPNVPTMLLELFSHQNFLDMRFGQDPMFRFHVSRSIYKGMLKFMSSLKGIPYVVQPLPVSHMRSRLLPGDSIALSWRRVEDPLEPGAGPDSYRVYVRVNDGGFDRGREVKDTVFTLGNIHRDSIYSFRVTALNRGGESFPSEVISACRASQNTGKAAIISAFDRSSGPAWFEDSLHAGFLPVIDQGVPYHVDLHTVGAQFDFRKDSPWLDDDAPGHGASYADLEARIIPGNSFDFGIVHGRALLASGYSFAGISDEALLEAAPDLEDYDLLDYLAGEERSTYVPKNDSVADYQVFPEGMLGILHAYLGRGGRVLISGAHIASDMHEQDQDSLVAGVLKYRWRTSNASRTGGFWFTNPDLADYRDTRYFNAGQTEHMYVVEGADALEPADSTSVTIMRYRENNMSAAVGYRGRGSVLSLGFPFESIVGDAEREEIMKIIINYLREDDIRK